MCVYEMTDFKFIDINSPKDQAHETSVVSSQLVIYINP